MKSLWEKSSDHFQTLRDLRGRVWSSAVSSLAVEASVELLQTFPAGSMVRVLQLGCHGGDDALFFAGLGWEVTVVDVSETELNLLMEQAAKNGLAHLIKIVCSTFVSYLPKETFQLVIANYTLHFLESELRESFFAKIMEHTEPFGIHAVLAISDLNEKYLGELKNYSYFGARELRDYYTGWESIDEFYGKVPDQHAGQDHHEHVVSVILARRPREWSKRLSIQSQVSPRLFLVALCIALLSIVLCSLGYANRTENEIAKVWAGSIFQAIAGALLGGWGVGSVILAGVVTNAINNGTLHSIFAFIPANFIQSFLPAWYYRSLLKKGGYGPRVFSFSDFLIFGVILPNIAGAFLGAIVLHTYQQPDFLPHFLSWLRANIPIAIVLGWPLFKLVGPSMVREGWVVKGWWR